MRRCLLFLGVFGILTLRFSTAQSEWPTDGQAVCAISPSQQTGPKIVSDGSGGAIISWTDSRGCVYAQRVDAAGNPLWAANGVSVCAGGSFSPTELAPDGAGGAFVVWYSGGVHAQRIDADGNVLWPVPYDFPSSGLLYDAISDGNGRVVFATYQPTGDPSFIKAQCLDGAGSPQWTTNGVTVESASGTLNYRWNPRLAPDGLGGAFVTWYSNGDLLGYDVIVQRVDASGTATWTAYITVTVGVGDNEPQIVSDGAGGAVIAWWAIAVNADVYAQRVDASGNRLWTTNGIPVCVQPNAQDGVFLASDGAAGAIVAWVDKRGGVDTDVYAQRIDGTGAAQWAPDGIAICDLPANQNACRVVTDDAGGAFIVWSDARNGAYDIYAQRVDGSGTPLWTEDGVALCSASGGQTVPYLASVASGVAMTAWQDARNGDNDIFAHRVAAGGSVAVGPTTPMARLALDGNTPNPFSGTTSLELRLAMDSDVRVELYDVTGKRVSTRDLDAWRRDRTASLSMTRSARGRRLPSGVYFCRVTASGETVARKITIAR